MTLYQKIKSKLAPNKSKLYDSLQRAWDHMGENEPFFSVITDDEFKSKNLSQEKIEAFYFSDAAKSNTFYIQESLKKFANRSLESFKNLKALDFGCGVGRNSIHLAPYFKELVGLDISEKHLENAREVCKKQNIDNAKFLKSDDQIRKFGNFDLIFSVITLQHIPPPLMKDYIHQLLSMLNPKGIAFLHFPIAAEGYKFLENKFILKEGEKLSWNMHILPEKAALKIIKKEGCRVLNIDKSVDLCGGKWKSAYFMIEKL